MIGQQFNVVASVAQAGQANFDGIQAKQQILTKTSRCYLRIHVDIGRGKNSDVDAARV